MCFDGLIVFCTGSVTENRLRLLFHGKGLKTVKKMIFFRINDILRISGQKFRFFEIRNDLGHSFPCLSGRETSLECRKCRLFSSWVMIQV